MAANLKRPRSAEKPAWPIRWIPGDDPDAKPAEGIALCLSGGGYRAMLFHLGALWRLNELGYLHPSKLKRVSSVSGGSLTAGVLAMNWTKLGLDASPVVPLDLFESFVVGPIRDQANRKVDLAAAFVGLADIGVRGSHLTDFYGHLFGKTKLADLSDAGPTFIFNATSLQSGEMVILSKGYMGDWRVGWINNPDLLLAEAVAASSSFPPVLSPTRVPIKPPNQWAVEGRGDLFLKPYTTELVLTDGGVYDNHGLEAAFKKYATILVSDADGLPAEEAAPHFDWPLQTYRVLMLFYQQIGTLRKRQLINAFQTRIRKGTYWSMASHVQDYPVQTPLACPVELTINLAQTPTRLEAMDDLRQKRIINWGYAIADTAMRSHVAKRAKEPAQFPYNDVGIG